MISLPDPRDAKSSRSQTLSGAGMGFEFAAAIVGTTLLGWLLDKWIGSTPIWTLVGALVGIVGGTYNLIRTAYRLDRAYEKSSRKSKAAQAPPSGTVTPPTQPPAPGAEAPEKAGWAEKPVSGPSPKRRSRYNPLDNAEHDQAFDPDDPQNDLELPPDHDKW